MTRNSETPFALNPTRLDFSRSKFARNSSYKTTFNIGDLIPFFVDEVLPGDTYQIRTSRVVRIQTLLTPLMDNVDLDTYYFFVPSRICWSHWEELQGANNESFWAQTLEYTVPQITAPADGWNIGTIADYMGIPTGVPGLSVNALPFRAYAMVCNEWFRDENLTDPLHIPVTDDTVQGVNTGDPVVDVAKGGLPFKAAKLQDYFTSCLPAPQKGPDVTIPVADLGNLPVTSLSDQVPFNSASAPLRVFENFDSPGSQLPRSVLNGPAASLSGYTNVYDLYTATGLGGTATSSGVVPANLWAIQNSDASVVTINQLRTAFQIQKLYERDARGGTRYIEILKSHFGVTSPDARLQRPEYLGGNRIPLNINQVVQSSGTPDSGGTPQGTTAAYSLTSDSHGDFIKSFVEHGYIIGVMVARYNHTYQQGLHRLWSRKDRFDFYMPVFANLGEQAVLNKEIYAQGTDVDDEVFGYQEAWAEYRYRPNMVTGEMRSSAPQSLDVWHLADYYTTLPTLSDSWIRETPETFDRVLAVSSRVSAQLFTDMRIDCTCTRPMPMYSVPGLVDHH